MSGSTTEFVSIIDYTVEGGSQAQDELVAAFAPLLEKWVAFYPGYVSARFHVSTDGTRVYNVVTWKSEADYRNFVENSDTDGRMAAIGTALESLTSGKAEPRMTGAPTYRMVRQVGPSAARS
ncbi:antibiotic biosynthesis monooxygenase family protein [Streptomyces sp. NPDC002535]